MLESVGQGVGDLIALYLNPSFGSPSVTKVERMFIPTRSKQNGGESG